VEFVPIVIGLLIVVVVLIFLWQGLALFVTIYDYERGLEYAGGRFVRVLEPGVHLRFRPSSRIDRVDIRSTLAVVPGQEVMSADAISLKVSLVARYRVIDPKVAINDVADHVGELYGALQLALREVIGSIPIEEVVATRAEVGTRVAELASPAATRLGLELLEADLRDIMFPGDLKRTFAQVVEARQHGLAQIERARAETAALRNLANAARLVDERPSLLQLRMLEQLAASSGNTIVLGPGGVALPPAAPVAPDAAPAPRSRATKRPT